MAEALRVAVRRGEFVECVHEVHAVAIRKGEIIVSVGDPLLVASLRSAAKPLQALPLARAYPQLDGEELAIAAASHYGTPRHVEAVRRLLAATGGSEDELDCGLQEGRPHEPIYDNCSGKHAGMIATCRAHGWPVEGYRLPGHPLQELLRAEVATAAGFEPGELVGGEGATDTVFMQAHPGIVAKGGAEGLLCASGVGMGLVLKVADGNPRALRPALAAIAPRLGVPCPEFEEVPVANRHGDPAATVSVL